VGSRAALSPAVTSSCPAVSTPTPGRATRCGATAVTSGVSWASRSSISACRACQRQARDRSATLVALPGSWTRPGRSAAQARMRWRGPSLRSGVRSGSGAETIRASIWAPAWMRLHRAAASHPQHADHLRMSIPRLQCPASAAGLHGPGCGLGIERIGLAVAAAPGAIGPVHLGHGQAIVGQEPQQPGTEAAGAFPPDLVHRSE
jgi:hypothetical protein